MKKAIAILILVFCANITFAQAPNDVPRDHWAYEAVTDLANKGLVLGYPDGSFLGNRFLTRYEFATVIARVLNEVNNRISESNSTTPASATTIPGVSQQDLENVAKLVDEFKIELTVIGTRLEKIETLVDELKAQVEKHNAILNNEDGALKKAQADISKLKKIGISGYVQARYQTINPTSEHIPENEYNDQFLVRRARLKIDGKMGARSSATLQLDASGNKVTIKDAYLDYIFGNDGKENNLSYTIGQFKWPFGYEVVYSSASRETPERALVFRRLFPGERDLGAKIMGPTGGKWLWQVGVFNGAGTENGVSSDPNDDKDIVANAQIKLGSLHLGASGYWGDGVWRTFGDTSTYINGVDKVRYGADLQYYFNQFTLKAEYARGKGIDAASTSWDQDDYIDGWYTQLNMNLNPSNMLVARYSTISEDPARPTLGRRNSWDLGYIRWLDNKTRMKIFYKINKEEFDEIDDNNGWIAEWLTTY